MELIADFLLLAGNAAACFYCYMLGRKLNKLQGTKNGIARSIATLSKSVEEAKTTIAHAHVAAEQSVDRLGPLLEQGIELETRLKLDLKAVEAALNALVESRAVLPDVEDHVTSERPMEHNTSDPEPAVDELSDDNSDESEIDTDGVNDDFEEIDSVASANEDGDDPFADDETSFDIDLDNDDFEIEWNADADASDDDDEGAESPAKDKTGRQRASRAKKGKRVA